MSRLLRVSKMEGKLETIESPRYIFFGPKAVRKITDVLDYMGSRTGVFLISGGTATRKVAEDLASIIDQEGRRTGIYSLGPGPTTSLEDVERAKDKFLEFRGDLVIGVGGGRPIDVAKLVASWTGRRYISVPTSPSHDGIASPAVGFLLRKEIEEKLGKGWTKTESPFVIIADTDIIKNAPRDTFKSGFGDLIGKITAVKDWELAHKLKDEPYSEYGASMAMLSARIAMDHAGDIRLALEESCRILIKALIGSGISISIAGSSRPASGSEHMFSHALDVIAKRKGKKSSLHGIQVGLGTIMMAYLQGQDWRTIRRKLIEAGAPVTAEEAGLDPQDVITALTIAHKIRNRYTILGESGLTRSAAEKLAKNTGVI